MPEYKVCGLEDARPVNPAVREWEENDSHLCNASCHFSPTFIASASCHLNSTQLLMLHNFDLEVLLLVTLSFFPSLFFSVFCNRSCVHEKHILIII